MAEAKRKVDSEVAQVQELWSALAKEEEEWHKASGCVPLKWSGKIKIDVGGKKFFTTMPVLRAKEG